MAERHRWDEWEYYRAELATMRQTLLYRQRIAAALPVHDYLVRTAAGGEICYRADSAGTARIMRIVDLLDACIRRQVPPGLIEREYPSSADHDRTRCGVCVPTTMTVDDLYPA